MRATLFVFCGLCLGIYVLKVLQISDLTKGGFYGEEF